MPSKTDLIVIGSQATLDHFAVTPSLPSVGGIAFAPGLTLSLKKEHFGGCSLNISLAAAKLGAKVSVFCTAGNDFYSSGYQAHLNRFNIDGDSILILDDKSCPHCYSLYDSEGDGLFFMDAVDASHSHDITVPEESFSKAKQILVVGGSDTSPLAASCLETAKRASELRIPVTLAVIGKAYEVSAEFVGLADTVFCNRFEAEQMCENFGLKDFESLINLGPRTFFITMGTNGSLVILKGKTFSISPVNVSTVVDPTGAGDAFAGATLTALINGYSPEVSAQVGSVVSSFVVEKNGCQTNLPSWKTMLQRYQSFFGLIH